MPGGSARRGRRDNGLVAQEYAVVGDVDPRVGEHLLDVLAAGGIAAYLQPATDLHPVTRTTTLPARPTDRLYADREHLATAKDYLAQLTAVPEQHTPAGELGQPATGFTEAKAGRKSDDEAFANIVAGYHVTVDPTNTPWPAAEDIDSAGSGVADMETEPRPRTSLRRAPGTIEQDSLLDGLDTFGVDLPDDDGAEGYTPPPPPPLPRLSAATVLAIASLLGGVLLLFWPELLPTSPDATLVVAFAAVLAGFVALILRLRPGDDEEDEDPDNGARV